MGAALVDPEINFRTSLDLIKQSKNTVVLSGAGISTPSGIPDFRSKDSGLWEIYDPFEVASLNAFRYHPEKFFTWMRPLASKVFNAKPNPAHIVLAQLEHHGYVNTIITQNMDGLHQQAGSNNVIEIHGSLNSLTCIQCYQQTNAETYREAYLLKGDIPRCPHCQGILKPDVILFGEQIPAKAWRQAQNASSECQLMIIVGSSLEVLPVAGLPMRAVENGAGLIIINQSSTYIDVRADVILNGDVSIILPRIATEVILA